MYKSPPHNGQRAANNRPKITRESSVLGVITHYQCEDWLHQAIESLVCQTHSLDGIVVLDDCSETAPRDIVEHFPGVTLLQSVENVGPYRLAQTIIQNTDYDAYLQQDADDWSRPGRLESLLEEAEHTGAEFIGTASANDRSPGFEETPALKTHPEDVNTAFKQDPDGWFLSWGTSIVSRDLVLRLGGLAGLRYGADIEFTSRAHYVAKVRNLTECHYDRRKRPHSLTTSPETGLYSQARKESRKQISQRNLDNADAAARGEPVDLTPLVTAQPVDLKHLAGPELRSFTRHGK